MTQISFFGLFYILFLYSEYKIVHVFKLERLQDQPMGSMLCIVLCTSSDFRFVLFRLIKSSLPKKAFHEVYPAPFIPAHSNSVSPHLTSNRIRPVSKDSLLQ